MPRYVYQAQGCDLPEDRKWQFEQRIILVTRRESLLAFLKLSFLDFLANGTRQLSTPLQGRL